MDKVSVKVIKGIVLFLSIHFLSFVLCSMYLWCLLIHLQQSHKNVTGSICVGIMQEIQISFQLMRRILFLLMPFYLPFQAISESASIQRTNGNSFTTSSLFVSYATQKHSGVYKCNPSNTGSASINVHVLDGTYLQTSAP